MNSIDYFLTGFIPAIIPGILMLLGFGIWLIIYKLKRRKALRKLLENTRHFGIQHFMKHEIQNSRTD